MSSSKRTEYSHEHDDHDDSTIQPANYIYPILPDEIWDEIFSYLSYEDLKTATLASKAFNRLIGNSTAFIRRTRVKVGSWWTEKSKDMENRLKILRSSQRYYRRALIVNIRTDGLRVEFSMFTNLTCLELRACTIEGLKLVHILRKCTAIKALNLDFVKIVEKSSELSQSVELNLTDLHIRSSNESTDWVFSHLHCIQITNYLGIHNTPSLGCERDKFFKFLNRIEGHIKTVELVDINFFSDNHVGPIHPLKFKWQSMTIANITCSGEESVILDQLSKACRQNAELKILQKIPCNAVTRYFVRPNNNITSLDYDGAINQQILSAFTENGTFDSVEAVDFRRFQCKFNNEAIGLVLPMFPNVRTLAINAEHLRFVYENIRTYGPTQLKKIKTLKLGFNWSRMGGRSLQNLPAIKLPQMESLELHPTDPFHNTSFLLPRTGSIEENLESLILNNRKLKVITFVGKFSGRPNERARSCECQNCCDLIMFLDDVFKTVCSSVESVHVAREEKSNVTKLECRSLSSKKLTTFISKSNVEN